MKPAGDPFDALGDPHRRAIVELLGARVAWFKDPDGNLLSLTQFA